MSGWDDGGEEGSVEREWDDDAGFDTVVYTIV